MKKFLVLLTLLIMISGSYADSNFGNVDGAKLLFNYFHDFINGGTLGTSNLGRIDGQKEYQNEFIDFIVWADTVASVTVNADTVYTDYIAETTADSGITLNSDLNISNIQTTTNPGAITIFNAPVDSTSADGTEHSLGFAIDGNTALKVKGSSDGNGGVDELQVRTYGGIVRNTTTVAAATYDLLASDDILLVTYTGTGAVTSLTLPSAQCVDGRTIVIKDAGGNAGTNNITIDSTDNIDGAGTLTINSDKGSYTLVSDGSTWHII